MLEKKNQIFYINFTVIFCSLFLTLSKKVEAKQREAHKFSGYDNPIIRTLPDYTIEETRYPLTCNVSFPLLTFTTKGVLKEMEDGNLPLLTHEKGIHLDVGVIIVNWKCWKFCNAYPQIGLLFQYNGHLRKVTEEINELDPITREKDQFKKIRLAKTLSFCLYIKTHFNYLKTALLIPRIGLGYMRVEIPIDFNHPDLLFREEEKYVDKNFFILFGFDNQIALYRQLFLTLNLSWQRMLLKEQIYKEEIEFIGDVQSTTMKQINHFMITPGLAYHFVSDYLLYKLPEYERKIRVDLNTIWARKSIMVEEEENYLVTGLQINFGRELFRHYGMAVTTEILWDNSVKRQTENFLDKRKLKLSLMLGAEALFGVILLEGKVGGTLLRALTQEHSSRNPLHILFFRTGGGIFIKKFFIGMGLKTKRLFEKDFIDLKLGYSIY